MHPIRVLDPNTFIQERGKELSPTEALAFSQLHGGEQFPRTNFFSLSRLENGFPYMRFPIPAHRPSFYSIMVVSQGEVVRTDGLNTYTLKAGSLYCHPAGSITSAESATADVEGYYCLFDTDYLLGPFANKALLSELPFFQPEASPIIVPDSTAGAYLLQLLGHMEYASAQEHPDKATSIAALLCAFLLEAKRHTRSLSAWLHRRQATAAETLTHRFKQLLQHHLLRKRSVAEYADLLAVTPSHLNRCVREITGRTAKDIMVEMLLLEARVLLKQPGGTVSEIAYRLGFATPSHFVKLFRSRQGITPLEYRNQALAFVVNPVAVGAPVQR